MAGSDQWQTTGCKNQIKSRKFIRVELEKWKPVRGREGDKK
jgi:hypothetical protein